MRKLIFVLPLVLAGCAGTSVKDVADALAADKANSCVVVHNAFPPFANDFTFVHQGDPSAAALPSCK